MVQPTSGLPSAAAPGHWPSILPLPCVAVGAGCCVAWVFQVFVGCVHFLCWTFWSLGLPCGGGAHSCLLTAAVVHWSISWVRLVCISYSVPWPSPLQVVDLPFIHCFGLLWGFSVYGLGLTGVHWVCLLVRARVLASENFLWEKRPTHTG